MTTATKIKLRRGTFQHIEAELYAYHDTLKEIAKLRNEILHASSEPDRVGGGRGNTPTDKTGVAAIRLATDKRLNSLVEVVEAIESVVERLPEKKRELVKLKYWSQPRTLTWDGIALRLDVSRRTAINWRNEIVYAIALKMGWR